MLTPNGRINPIPLTILAAGALVWATVAVAIGAVGPSGIIPQIFHSSHVEHFLGFYIIGVLGTAGLPSIRLIWIFLTTTALAVAFGLMRYFFIPAMHASAIEDALAETAGAGAALLPILIGMHRQAYRAWRAGRNRSQASGTSTSEASPDQQSAAED